MPRTKRTSIIYYALANTIEPYSLCSRKLKYGKLSYCLFYVMRAEM